MFNIIKKEINFNNQVITLESGKMARQADSSILVTHNKTQILVNIVYQKNDFAINSFFPLTVMYQEKYYAVGKFPGGFIKREGKLSNDEVITSRLIDRSIRPLFHPDFFNETQVICTVLSYDKSIDTSFLALLGVVAAALTSGAPFMETIAPMKVGYKNNDFFVNTAPPSANPDSLLNMFVSGTKNSVLMVESEASSIPEDKAVEAIEFALKHISPLIDFLNDFAAELNGSTGKEPKMPKAPDTTKLKEDIKNFAHEKFSTAYQIKNNKERSAAVKAVDSEITTCFKELLSKYPEISSSEELAFCISRVSSSLKKTIVRDGIIAKNERLDARKVDEVRPIDIELNPLLNVHGSALFTRGETQALATITLGGDTDEQMVDTIHGVIKENFMLQYNFPSFSVGECGRFAPPGRREIGHGNLARKSLKCVMPTKDQFQSSIRVVSEILESNGSSSMASVCAGSLAMLAAGIPLKDSVSGIAMGLILKGDEFVILTDIAADEDHVGDMDFKVSGTQNGITALQMDIKVTGITTEIIKKAIEQAKTGRLFILQKMLDVIKSPNKISSLAPSKEVIKIPENKIRNIIGAGGSVIKGICEKSSATINVEQNGNVNICGTAENIEIAKKLIAEVLSGAGGDSRGDRNDRGDRGDRGDRNDRDRGDRGDRGDRNDRGDRGDRNDRDRGDRNDRNFNDAPSFKENEIITGTVKKILDHGAIIEFPNRRSGFVHISELAASHVNKVEDVLEVDEVITVKVIGFDLEKRAKLSLKCIDQVTQQDISSELPPPRRRS